MKRSILGGLGLVLVAQASLVEAGDCANLLDPGQVLNLHLTMAPADWDALRFSCPGGYCGSSPHFYWSAVLRCEDGPELTVGIRRKNGKAVPSETDPQKPALKIDFNEFVTGQTFFGKDKLNLENGGDSSGPNEGDSGGNGIREGVSWLLYGDAGIVSSRVAWINVSVNGQYKGLYTHVEQVDKAFLADHGIDDGGWLFKGPSSEQRTREGEPNPFAFNWYPFDHVNPAGPQPSDWHDQTEWRVDLSQLLTLAAVTNFVANKDGAVFKNNNYWYYDWAIFPEGQQPRLYFAWDLDTTMNAADADLPVLGVPHNSGHMARALIHDDPVFQAQYYQIYGALMNGPLSLSSTMERLNQIEPVISPHLDSDPYQTAGTAAAQFQDVREFLQARTAFVQAALGACPNAACEPAETQCSCPADCGFPPPSESICTDLIDGDCDGAIDCSDGDCGAAPACQTVPPANRIVVNEVGADSQSPDVEYVEILNSGPGAEDLTGWYLLDNDNSHDKCLLEGILAPGEYLVVAAFIDDFIERYPEAASSLNPNPFDSEVSGQGFGLGNGGDEVRLFRPGGTGDVFVSGYTFGRQDEDIPFGYLPEGSDAPEYLTFPTPGQTNDVASVYSPVCINEFSTTSSGGGADDWVELYNRGTVAAAIGGWYLSDSASQPFKYVFPPGTSIAPGGFLTVDESQLGFAFSSTGSEVIMLTHANGVTGQDYFDYGPQFPDVTQGRFPDGASNWRLFSSPSRGLPNACWVDQLVFVSPTSFAWNAYAGATGYDIVKGDLGLLRSTSGNFSLAVTACQGNDIQGTTWQDDGVVAAGQGTFHLVRAIGTPCGNGTYDSGSASQAAGRDAAIQGAAAACP